MEIFFSSQKMQKICSSEKESTRTWGKQNGARVRLCLTQLAAAENLAVMMASPFGRCHPLKGNRRGQFAVDVKHPFRLMFEPAHDPLPLKEDGGLELAQVTRSRVLEIGDYHGD